MKYARKEVWKGAGFNDETFLIEKNVESEGSKLGLRK